MNHESSSHHPETDKDTHDMLPLKDAIQEYLQDGLGPVVGEDEEAIRRSEQKQADRQLETRRRDLASEAGGNDAEIRDLIDYAEETEDPTVAQKIEELKRTDLEVEVERRNLPPEE